MFKLRAFHKSKLSLLLVVLACELLLLLPVFMSLAVLSLVKAFKLFAKLTEMQLGVPGTSQLSEDSIVVSVCGDWERINEELTT